MAQGSQPATYTIWLRDKGKPKSPVYKEHLEGVNPEDVTRKAKELWGSWATVLNAQRGWL